MTPYVHVAVELWSLRGGNHRDHGVNVRGRNCSAVNSIAERQGYLALLADGKYGINGTK